MRVANRDCRSHVRKRIPFHGSNLYGVYVEDRYVVYSYGTHWPMFVWENGQWYEIASKYSRSTSRHHSQAHPHEDTLPMELDAMLVLAEYGIAGVAVGINIHLDR